MKTSLLPWLGVLAVSFGIFAWNSHFSASTAQAQVNMAPSNLSGAVQGGGMAGNAQVGPENIMILLDASYSMGETLPSERRGSENKMMAAKRTVMEVLQTLPPDVRVGLRVYGNTSNQFTACHATNTLVPIGQNNHSLMSSKLIGLRPTGATPISYSIQRSLNEDFRFVDGQRSILLISDGIETCGEDPCDMAVRLQKMGANVKINVVGLGLEDYAAVKQLRCVALATKGKFYTANTAAELANSLTNAMMTEARVQATILPSPNRNAPSGNGNPPANTPDNAVSPLKRNYEDKLLPAAVPITPRKR